MARVGILSWNSLSGATYHDVGVTARGNRVVDTRVSALHTPPSLGPGKPYRWNVAACNSAACSVLHHFALFSSASATPTNTRLSALDRC